MTQYVSYSQYVSCISNNSTCISNNSTKQRHMNNQLHNTSPQLTLLTRMVDFVATK